MLFLLTSLKPPSSRHQQPQPHRAVAEQGLKPKHAPHARPTGLKGAITGSVPHLRLLKILEPHLHSIGRGICPKNIKPL